MNFGQAHRARQWTIRLLAILALLVIANSSIAQSQSPTPTVISDPQQEEPTASDEHAAPKEGAAEAMPPIIEVAPTPNADPNIIPEQKKAQKDPTTDWGTVQGWLIVAFTSVLTACTAILVVVAYRQNKIT